MEIQNFCEYFNIPTNADISVQRADDPFERMQIVAEYFSGGGCKCEHIINFDMALLYAQPNEAVYSILYIANNMILNIPKQLFDAIFIESNNFETASNIPHYIAVFSQSSMNLAQRKTQVEELIKKHQEILHNHHIPEIIYDLDFDNLMIGGNASC